jgi:hypothetical protein
MCAGERTPRADASAPEPAAAAAAPAAHVHREEGLEVRVEQGARQRLRIAAAGRVALAPAAAYEILTHADNTRVFSHLEACTKHAVLADDGAGRQTVESTHLARWRFWFLTGTLATTLRLEQDAAARTSAFALVGGGVMREFAGAWHVRAVEGDPGAADVALEQALAPARFLPPPVGALLGRIAVGQLRGVYADLRAEAARVRAGAPTLWAAGAEPHE